MYLDTNNESYLSTNSEIKIDNTELTVNSIKEQLNLVDINKFNWTPEHLESLINNWYCLWVVVYSCHSEWSSEYEKYSYVDLFIESYTQTREKIRVYYGADLIKNDDYKEIDNLYIIKNNKKQLVNPELQPLLYSHFTGNVNLHIKPIKTKDSSENWPIEPKYLPRKEPIALTLGQLSKSPASNQDKVDYALQKNIITQDMIDKCPSWHNDIIKYINENILIK